MKFEVFTNFSSGFVSLSHWGRQTDRQTWIMPRANDVEGV